MEHNSYISSPSASPSNTTFSNGPYLDNTSDSSSPNSPHQKHIMYNHSAPYETYQYNVTPASYYPAQAPMKIPVAITSSTLDEKDRRRKRSEASQNPEKEATPNMHLRRRAQNRASQRAFRERKEKHVKGLEHQLEELHEKHQDLLHSYTKQADEVARLKGRIAELAAELNAARNTQTGSFSDIMIPPKFDKFDAFSSTDLIYPPTSDMYYDRGPIDLNSEFALHSFEDCL